MGRSKQAHGGWIIETSSHTDKPVEFHHEGKPESMQQFLEKLGCDPAAGSLPPVLFVSSAQTTRNRGVTMPSKS
jgi:hypothetical protein